MRKILIVLAVLAMGALTAQEADAAFRIRVSENGGATYVLNVTDNGTGDLSPTVGAITATYSDAVVAFSVVVGQSKPLIGNGPNMSALDIGINGTFGTGGTLTVDITDTDFMPPGSPAGFGTLTTRIGSSAPAGTTATGYLNGDDPGTAGPQGNLEFGGIDGTNAGTLITTPTASAPGNLVTSADGTAYPAYSMAMRTTFSGGPGSGFSLDNNLSFVNPAPAALVLVLTGFPVLGLGAFIRRRRTPRVANP